MYIAFHGVDHKVGTTLLAQTTAEWYAQNRPKSRVLLVAFNRRKSCDFIREEPPSLETFRIPENGSPPLAEQVFRRFQVQGNFYAMAGLEQEWNDRRYFPNHAEHIIGEARHFFQVIIADTGCDLDSGLALGALQQPGCHVLVTTQSEGALGRWEEQRERYRQLNISFFMAVLNKHQREHPLSLSYVMERMEEAGEFWLPIPYAPDGYRAEWEKRSLLSYHHRGCHRQLKNLMHCFYQWEERKTQ
jgi:hypothetical protein